MRIVPSLIVLCLSLPTPAVAWTRIASERYGTSVEVPDGYRTMRAPTNGDGRTVLALDGRASIAIFAGQDVLHDGLAPPAGLTIEYQAHGPHWSVYSGRQGTRIVYERMIAACPDRHLVHHVRIDYDRADQATMAAIVARVANSLRGGCAE